MNAGGNEITLALPSIYTAGDHGDVDHATAPTITALASGLIINVNDRLLDSSKFTLTSEGNADELG